MNREQTIEAIKVMQAWVDGKVIQVGKQKAPWLHPDWKNLTGSASGEHVVWDFTSISIQYRIKPAPLERWIVTDGAGNETLYFHDPRPGLAVLETAAMFVEVIEDEAKPIQSPTPTPTPSTGPLVIGDRVKFIGNLKDVPVGTLATVTAANPNDPTVGVEFDGGKRHKGFTVWRTSLERVIDPGWTYEFNVGDCGHTTGGWSYEVVGKDESEAANGQPLCLRVLHGGSKGEYWHALDGKHGKQPGFDLLPPTSSTANG